MRRKLIDFMRQITGVNKTTLCKHLGVSFNSKWFFE